MKLHEIIKTFESGKESISIEELQKYRKSLNTYYNSYFNSEPLLMVTAVFNTCSFAIIVPSSEFNEAVSVYLNDNFNCSDEDNDDFAEYETICFNSIPLSLL